MQAIGLKTHIWNNALKTVLLLLGFPFLMLMIAFGFNLVYVAMFENPYVLDGINEAARLLPRSMAIALAASGLWFLIAFFSHQRIVDGLTGAQKVERKSEPRLHNMVENLAISRGQPIPSIRVIETQALNAYASGIRREHYTITVTRGLLEALNDDELEAVLAHEMTHIINRDVQLIMVAAVFAGIISLAGDFLIRGFFRTGVRYRPTYRTGGSSSSPGKGGGGGGALVLILIAVAIFIIARLTAVALRLAISRRREYMADAGAVEMTKNPDAMIAALRKIENRSNLGPIPGQIEALFIDSKSGSFWATHPSIGDRCAALVRYGGGRDPGPRPLSSLEEGYEGYEEQETLKNAKELETGGERAKRETRPKASWPLPGQTGPWG